MGLRAARHRLYVHPDRRPGGARSARYGLSAAELPVGRRGLRPTHCSDHAGLSRECFRVKAVVRVAPCVSAIRARVRLLSARSPTHLWRWALLGFCLTAPAAPATDRFTTA